MQFISTETEKTTIDRQTDTMEKKRFSIFVPKKIISIKGPINFYFKLITKKI